MIWAAMSSVGVGPLCFLKSTVNTAIYQEILRALHASFCWQALWRCWFHFPEGLGTTLPKVPKAGSMTMVLMCLIGQQTRLTWTPIENIWGIVKRKMRDTRPNNADDLTAIKATWASITPEQCHRLIASMPRRIDAVIHAKGGPTKYWLLRNEHTFQKPDISV